MEDLFKKFIYTGVGLVAHTAEKIHQSVDKLIKENKISADEGKKIIDDFVKNTQAKKEEFESHLKTVVSRFNYAKEDDLKALRKRVEALEKEVKKLSKVKPAAKPMKATASKTK